MLINRFIVTRDVYLLFFYDTIQYWYWQNDTNTIRYDTKPLKISLFPFGLLVYSAYSIIVFRGHNFPKNMHLIFLNHSFLCQTSSILINIIIKVWLKVSFICHFDMISVSVLWYRYYRILSIQYTSLIVTCSLLSIPTIYPPIIVQCASS